MVPFCMYSEQQWQQAGKRLLPACELEFMQFLRAHNIDTWFASQVVADFWPAPLDFYNMHHQYFVQIDGRCHWVGMHQRSSREVIERDLRQAEAAVAAGAGVVRVHVHDIHNHDAVAASLEAATLGYSIVLTPAYASARVWCDGQQLLYMHLLGSFVRNCCYDTDSYGNIRINKSNTLT